MHGDKAEACKYERERKGQVVVVVHRPQQHCERHQSEYEADTGWKNVNAAGPQSSNRGIHALALSGPATDATPCSCR